MAVRTPRAWKIHSNRFHLHTESKNFRRMKNEGFNVRATIIFFMAKTKQTTSRDMKMCVNFFRRKMRWRYRDDIKFYNILLNFHSVSDHNEKLCKREGKIQFFAHVLIENFTDDKTTRVFILSFNTNDLGFFATFSFSEMSFKAFCL